MIAALRGTAHLVVFLLAWELTCRVDDGIRFGTPLMSRVLSSEDLREHDGASIRGRPNARFQKFVLNELGLRGPAAKQDRSPGVTRIVTVGASETFGLTESIGREFPRQLEDSLNASRSVGAVAPAFEVLNAALPGMSLPTIDLDLRRRVRLLAPDIVLLYPSPSFYVDRHPPHAPTDVRSSGDLPLRRAFYPRAFNRLTSSIKGLLPPVAMRWLRQRDIDAAIAGQPRDWRFTTVPDDRLRLFDRDLRLTVGIIREIGATPVLATHGNAFMGGKVNEDLALSWVRFYPRATAATLIAFDSAAREVTLRVAEDSGIVAVDVARALAEARGTVYSDFVHFTDAGASQVALALRDPVLTLIPRAPARDSVARVRGTEDPGPLVSRTARE